MSEVEESEESRIVECDAGEVPEAHMGICLELDNAKRQKFSLWS